MRRDAPGDWGIAGKAADLANGFQEWPGNCCTIGLFSRSRKEGGRHFVKHMGKKIKIHWREETLPWDLIDTKYSHGLELVPS